MAYTTVAAVKNALPFEYWISAQTKLEEDGYDFDLTPTRVFTDEAVFLTVFIDRCASFIDDFVGGGPFLANGALEMINRWLAIYEVEQYLLAGTNDRVISVSINEDKKRALQLLVRILDGDITVIPDGTGDTAGTYDVELYEDSTDGVTLTIGTLEEDILLGGLSDATEIPEY